MCTGFAFGADDLGQRNISLFHVPTVYFLGQYVEVKGMTRLY
jgi:hypothetical protein